MGDCRGHPIVGGAARPLLKPAARIGLAFFAVFGSAGLILCLMEFTLGGILFFLSSGMAVIIIILIRTPAAICTHYNARQVLRGEIQRLDLIIDDLSARFGVHSPRLMIVPSGEPNAFTVGSGRRVCVGVTQGLLRTLDDKELSAVMAHEFAHIRSRDVVLMSLAVAVRKSLIALAILFAVLIVIAGMVIAAVLLSLAGSKSKRSIRGMMIIPVTMAVAMVIASPILLSICQFLFSRRAEYRADACSSVITRKPLDLARALTKIDQYSCKELAAAKWCVYSSLWISGNGGGSFLERLQSSHPPVQERIRRLEKLHLQMLEGSI